MVHTHQDSIPRFTEFPSLSRIYRVPISIQGLQSSRLYPGFTEFPSLSRVYKVPVSIQGLQSSRLYPRFTEFPSLSRVYRVPVSIFSLFLARWRGKRIKALYGIKKCIWKKHKQCPDEKGVIRWINGQLWVQSLTSFVARTKNGVVYLPSLTSNKRGGELMQDLSNWSATFCPKTIGLLIPKLVLYWFGIKIIPKKNHYFLFVIV